MAFICIPAHKVPFSRQWLDPPGLVYFAKREPQNIGDIWVSKQKNNVLQEMVATGDMRSIFLNESPAFVPPLRPQSSPLSGFSPFAQYVQLHHLLKSSKTGADALKCRFITIIFPCR